MSKWHHSTANIIICKSWMTHSFISHGFGDINIWNSWPWQVVQGHAGQLPKWHSSMVRNKIYKSRITYSYWVCHVYIYIYIYVYIYMYIYIYICIYIYVYIYIHKCVCNICNCIINIPANYFIHCIVCICRVGRLKTQMYRYVKLFGQLYIFSLMYK